MTQVFSGSAITLLPFSNPVSAAYKMVSLLHVSLSLFLCPSSASRPSSASFSKKLRWAKDLGFGERFRWRLRATEKMAMARSTARRMPATMARMVLTERGVGSGCWVWGWDCVSQVFGFSEDEVVCGERWRRGAILCGVVCMFGWWVGGVGLLCVFPPFRCLTTM
ncbi:hypothetical protein B0T14DRAFT_135225 [Immersiella caudata]|uniref:Uncharacterized protein n=1 Tax=Immersiella caudata TaxID=314043 RepID=A0AA39X4X0_9PEZI|nr:hypothetical protein B0T14DRAFT_135225 [Immersiella caudata]